MESARHERTNVRDEQRRARQSARQLGADAALRHNTAVTHTHTVWLAFTHTLGHTRHRRDGGGHRWRRAASRWRWRRPGQPTIIVRSRQSLAAAARSGIIWSASRLAIASVCLAGGGPVVAQCTHTQTHRRALHRRSAAATQATDTVGTRMRRPRTHTNTAHGYGDGEEENVQPRHTLVDLIRNAMNAN